jgi:hypothetical protein
MPGMTEMQHSASLPGGACEGSTPSQRPLPRPTRRARLAAALGGAILWGLAGLAGGMPGTAAQGATAEAGDPAQLCERAAETAAAETGVPAAVLKAIALVETGRRRGGVTRPWPWALNMGGPGAWLETEAAALAKLRAVLDSGAENVDVGCFQINHRWHGAAFASLEEMIDPVANARHAARFLLDLHAEFGTWAAAAGAYHSRTPERAERYRARFETQLAKLDDGTAGTADDMSAPPDTPAARINTFPLLQPGPPSGAGSIVPATPGRGPLIVVPARAGLLGSG